MTDFPDLKIQALVSFPAAVYGGTGLAVRQENGKFYFDLAFGELAEIAAVPLPVVPTTFVALWESTQDTYRRINLTNLQTQIGGGGGGSLVAGKNKIINGGFTINQRDYIAGAGVAAGVYTHDRWKAGAGGGGSIFAPFAGPVTITVFGTIIQIVEDKNVSPGGQYTLSWTGTALGRVGINSAVPSGAFAVSPLTFNGQNEGTTMSVEFNAGTLGKVQLEAGAVASPFDVRPYQTELFLCQRYCTVIFPGVSGSPGLVGGINGSTGYYPWNFVQRMLATPTVSMSAAADWSNNPFSTPGTQQPGISVGFSGATSPVATRIHLVSNPTSAPAGAMGELTAVATAAKLTAVSEL